MNPMCSVFLLFGFACLASSTIDVRLLRRAERETRPLRAKFMMSLGSYPVS